jgi:hypothetical protein
MKSFPNIPCLVLAGLLAFGSAGCVTTNVNPPQAQANTGYVDFHADGGDELFWQVERFEEPSQSYNKVFSELAAPKDGCLRLAFKPGNHRLRITFLNRVVVQPAEVDVAVTDGKIIPLRVTLTPEGTTLVQTKGYSPGGTAKGHYGLRSKYGSEETVRFRLSAMTAPPAPYQPKEQKAHGN